MILRCSYCQNINSKAARYQDVVYGPGYRVHNPMKKGARCTVCGRERFLDTPPKNAAKQRTE